MCNLDNVSLRWNNILLVFFFKKLRNQLMVLDEGVCLDQKQGHVTSFWKCSTYQKTNPTWQLQEYVGWLEANCLLKEMGLIYLRGPIRIVNSTMI